MKSFKQILILCLFIFVALSGIVYAQSNSNSNDKQAKDSSEPIINHKFVDEDLISALNIIAEETDVTILYESSVKGKITCQLVDVPFTRAMEMLLMTTPYIMKNMDGYYIVLEARPTHELKIVVISGNVGISGAVMRGTPGSIVSSEPDGSYTVVVPYGWGGMVTPEKEGFVFRPPFKQYSNVSRDVTNQNYNAQVQLLSISDTIELKGKGIQGVNVTANPGNIKTVTDSRGQFSIQVPYGWSGEITLSKLGLDMFSTGKQYEKVTTDIINGIPVPPTNVLGTITPQSNSFQSQIGKSAGRRILVVPSGEIDSEDISETKEDILVMAEILDERFREPRLIEGVLRDFGDFFGRDNKQTEAIYMQEYGVVFMMEVNYNFSSLSQPEEEVETHTESDIDETWEQARQRVLSRGAGTQASAGGYEKQMVEILKTELIRTLKYASNIRNIKPDDWVILSVCGVNRQSMPLMGAGLFNNYSVGGEYGGGMIYGGSYGYGGGSFSSYGGTTVSGGFGYGTSGSMNSTQRNTGTVSPTASVMTIRVKKSDVDEFANDKIDLEQFRQKVQILLY